MTRPTPRCSRCSRPHDAESGPDWDGDRQGENETEHGGRFYATTLATAIGSVRLLIAGVGCVRDGRHRTTAPALFEVPAMTPTERLTLRFLQTLAGAMVIDRIPD